MSLVGNLKDLGLAEILQIVSLSRKSGVLGIRNEDQEARVVFRQGQVVKATATTCPVDLPEMLLNCGLVDSANLESAKFLQHSGGFSRRLGDILISDFMVDETKFEEIVSREVENAVYSLFEWEEGTFDFDLQENLDSVDDLRSDPLQYILKRGHNPQFLAMEGSRKLDEKRHEASISGCDTPDENVDFEFDLLVETEELVSPVEADTIPPLISSETRLILVDDDESTRNSLSAFLSSHGYSVSSIGTGEDGLIAVDTLCREGSSPLLLVDLVMPRMDGTGLLGGLELLELVHSNFSELRVLVMSDRRDLQAERILVRMGYPMIFKPSPKEMAAENAVKLFCERLLTNLNGLVSGELKCGAQTVNIGDDLRMEMGEEAVTARAVTQSTGISLLRGMLEELNDPALGGGITLLVLRFASEFMARAVIFTVKGTEIVGLGQFGIDDLDQSGDMRVRSLKFPLGEKTIFSEVVETQLPVKLQMDDSLWCRYLQENLGGNATEAFLGPIVSEGKVVAILYGDNVNDSRPIGDTDSLEIFLSQAGIAMEKGLLQRRLKEKHMEEL